MSKFTASPEAGGLCHTQAVELSHELDRLHEQLARLGELASALLSTSESDSGALACPSCLEALIVAQEEYGRAFMAMRRRVPNWATGPCDSEDR
jgi:hypothetical protein